MAVQSSQPITPTATFRRWALLMVMSTLVVRILIVVLLRADLQDDPDAYAHIAETLRTHSQFAREMQVADEQGRTETLIVPTAYRPPLYPMILSVFVQKGKLNRVAVAGLHVIAGTITAYLVFIIAWRLGMARLSFVAAMGVAVDPLLLNASAIVMTETVATLCATAALVAVTRFYNVRDVWSAMAAGFFMVVCIYCRPTFIVWTGLIGLLMLRDVVQHRIKLIHAAVFCGVIMLVMLPWILRNNTQIGKPVIATTHGGYTLLLANNQSLFDHQSGTILPDVWVPDEEFKSWNSSAMKLAVEKQQNGIVPHWELEYDRLCNERARQAIAANPLAFVKASLLRIVQLWRPIPNQIAADESRQVTYVRYGIGAWYCVLFALTIAALWRIRDKLFAHPWCWAVLLLISITLIHAFYWSNIRMRAPAMPVIYLLAAYGVGRFAASRRRKRRRAVGPPT